MLLPLNGRSIAYDLIGSETAPVVCMTHSLASDGGMWAEQVPALRDGRGIGVVGMLLRGRANDAARRENLSESWGGARNAVADVRVVAVR